MSHFLNSKDIGSVTAYGDALEGGYNGTRESFYATLMSQEGEFALPVNPSVKPEECTMYIDDVQGDREDVTIPTYASGKIVYDGESHTAVFDDVDTELMNVGGTFTATNAGTYYAEFTLKDTDTYQWTDGGIWKQRLPWTIEKMAGVLTLSESIIGISDSEPTKTITFTASNTVTVEVEDEHLATASVSGNTIIVNAISGSLGATNITVTCAESETQAGVQKVIPCYVNFAPIYGAEWDGTSSTKWTRTDDAASFVDPVPAIANGTGSSPFDNIYPWSDIKIIEDDVAGTLVQIPKYYYKWTYSGAKMKLQISPLPFAGSLVSPRHADCGDGQGERDVIYVGRYPCATDTFKSATNSTLHGGLTRAEYRTSIHALGNDIWQQDFALYWTIRNLMYVEYADWNLSAAIGKSSSDTALTYVTGATDAMKYHTGTTAIDRTTAGVIQYRHMEMFNQLEFVDGLYFSSAAIYVGKKPSTYADSTVGMTRVLSRASTSGNSFAKTLTKPTVAGYEFALYEETTGATATTYTCGKFYYYSGYSIPYLQHGEYFGFSCINTSTKYPFARSRVMKLPNNS